MKTQIAVVAAIVGLAVFWTAAIRTAWVEGAPTPHTSILCTDATRQRLADLYAGSAKAGGIHKEWADDIKAGKHTAEEVRVGGDVAWQMEWVDFYDRSEKLAMDLGTDSLGPWCVTYGVREREPAMNPNVGIGMAVIVMYREWVAQNGAVDGHSEQRQVNGFVAAFVPIQYSADRGGGWENQSIPVQAEVVAVVACTDNTFRTVGLGDLRW